MHIYWSNMGFLCRAIQMGLTEQLLYLGICLTICKDQGQSCEHWYGDNNVHSCHLIRLISMECASSIRTDTISVIHLQFWAYGSWDSLFPVSMSPSCKLMSPKHYFSWQVCNTIASRDSPGLAEIKTYAQKMQDAQVTKSLQFKWVHVNHVTNHWLCS